MFPGEFLSFRNGQFGECLSGRFVCSRALDETGRKERVLKLFTHAVDTLYCCIICVIIASMSCGSAGGVKTSSLTLVE